MSDEAICWMTSPQLWSFHSLAFYIFASCRFVDCLNPENAVSAFRKWLQKRTSNDSSLASLLWSTTVSWQKDPVKMINIYLDNVLHVNSWAGRSDPYILMHQLFSFHFFFHLVCSFKLIITWEPGFAWEYKYMQCSVKSLPCIHELAQVQQYSLWSNIMSLHHCVSGMWSQVFCKADFSPMLWSTCVFP